MAASGATEPRVLFVAAMAGLGGPVKRLTTLLANIHGVQRVLIKPRSELLDGRLDELNAVDEYIALKRSVQRSYVGAVVLMITVFVRAASRRRPIDVIHANGIVEFALCWPAALLLRKPVLTWVGNYECPSLVRRFAPLFRTVARRTGWNAVSSTAADVIAECGLADRLRIEVVTNIVDPLDVASTKVGGGGRARRVTVGYLQVARWVKGFDLLPGVIEELSDIHDRVQFLIIGKRDDGVSWNELAALPSEVVQVRPRTANVGDIYAACDIVFSPSRRESFNRVVAEALTTGTPVVASDLRAVREVVGDAGLLFPSGDVVAAAAAIRRLVSDPELRATLGKAGLVRSKAWLPAPVAERFLAQYRHFGRIDLNPTLDA